MKTFFDKYELFFGKYNKSIQGTALIIAAIAGILGIRFCNKSSSNNLPPTQIVSINCDNFQSCSGIHGISEINTYTYQGGFTPEFYHIMNLSDSLDLTTYSSPEILKPNIDIIKNEIYINIVESFGFYHDYDLNGFLLENSIGGEEFNKLIETLKDRSHPISNAIQVYQIDEYYDCSKCEYRYDGIFYTPKDSRLLIPDDIRKILDKYIELSPSYQKLLQLDYSKSVSDQVNLVNIVIFLLDNGSFKEELSEELIKFQDYLNFMDSESLKFFSELSDGFAIQNFKSGEFKMGAIMSHIMNKVVDLLEKNITKYPLDDWKVKVVGFADQSKIKGGIEYHHDGQWSSTKEDIPFESKRYEDISPSIISNNELSYARAYMGANFLINNISSNLVPRVKISYSGKGVDEREVNKWQKRRIEIHLNKK